MATPTAPSRNGRPCVSLTMTPTRTPRASAIARRIASADPSGSFGSVVTHCGPPPTLLWYPGVRADEPAPVLGDDEPGPHAQHRARFVQDDLAQARILLGLFGQLHRPRPRRDFVQIDDAAFRLGDDFLRHDQDIEIFWRHIV